jgi:hypothetical protein
MARKYQKISTHSPVLSLDYEQADFEDTLRYLQPVDEKETLTAAGAASLDYLVSHLSAAAGTYAITLDDGTVEGEEKHFFHVGSGGTFNVSGSGSGKFWDWTTFVFTVFGRSGYLRWTGGKWLLVGGECGRS